MKPRKERPFETLLDWKSLKPIKKHRVKQETWNQYANTTSYHLTVKPQYWPVMVQQKQEHSNTI